MSVTETNRDLSLLNDVFREKVELFLEEAWDRIFITEAFRSQERQNYLYKQGREAPYLDKQKVTWTLDSMHTKGLAIDIAFKWAELYPSSMYTWWEIGEIANKYGIDWGWDLWKTDKPHFQDNWKPLEDKKDYETLKRENEILRRRSNETDVLLNQALKANKPNKYDS